MTKTIQHYLEQAEQILKSSDNQHLEAEVLLAHALQKPRSYLYAWPDEVLSIETERRMQNYLLRRQKGEPIAYILGKREFWSLDFLVTRDTLIPRPETELLVETILKRFENQDELKLADLGTGCGAIAIALAFERPSWQIYASDLHENALAVAKQNAQRLQIKNLAFFQGNWCTALPCS